MSFMVNERLRTGISARQLTALPASHAEFAELDLIGMKSAHPVMHLGGDAVVAEHGFRIAQTDRFALDNEAPQGVARFGNQPGAGRVPLSAIVAFMFGERRQRRFESATLPPECGGLFLGNLIIKRRRARHSRT